MSEEEKKAIEILNKLNFSCDSYYIVENGLAKDIDYILIRNAIKTIKNLIEKQQKETEEFKIRYDKREKRYTKYLENAKTQYEKNLEVLQKEIEELEADNYELNCRIRDLLGGNE